MRLDRFPLITVGGPIRRTPWSIGISFGTYLNRDYALATQDTLVLRGVGIPVFDTVISKGGVNDFRFAVGYRTGKKGSVGLGLHVLSGSTRNELRRTFFDTAYTSGRQTAELSYQTLGLSFGIVQAFGNDLVVAGSARYDGTLKIDRDTSGVAETKLPMTFNGGLKYRVAPRLAIAASGTYRSWRPRRRPACGAGCAGRCKHDGRQLGPRARHPAQCVQQAAARREFGTPRCQSMSPEGRRPTKLRPRSARASSSATSGPGIDLAVEYVQAKDGTAARSRRSSCPPASASDPEIPGPAPASSGVIAA